MARLDGDYRDLYNDTYKDRYDIGNESRWRITRKEKAQAIEFMEKHGRVPTAEDKLDIFDNKDKIDDAAKVWMENFFVTNQDALTEQWNENGVTEKMEAAKARDNTPFYYDPSKMNVEGTKENEMLNMYNKANEDTKVLYDKQNEQTELDMIKEMDNQRRQTLDEIRNRRRTMLKNGLSSAQIANEEVQSLMMSQSNQRQIGAQYMQQRDQVANQYGMNKANAGMNVMGMMNTNNQTGSAFAAAKTADADWMAQRYKQGLESGAYTSQQFKTTTGQQ